jgi:hypothetical protein
MKEVMLRTRRSPWIILLGLTTLAAALFATYVAAVWRWVDCSVGGAPQCVPGSLWQLYAAVAGVPVAALVVIESVRAVGRPLLWFVFVVAAYSVWGGLAYYALHVL